MGDVAQWQRVRFACGKSGVRLPASPSAMFEWSRVRLTLGASLVSTYSSVVERSIAEYHYCFLVLLQCSQACSGECSCCHHDHDAAAEKIGDIDRQEDGQTGGWNKRMVSVNQTQLSTELALAGDWLPNTNIGR